MKSSTPRDPDASPLATTLAVILPALLGFGPLFMAIASPAAGAMKIAMLVGAVMVSTGLDGLFYLLARQQRQITDLRAQLALASAPEGDTDAA
jgi:membrane protein involved in colicin uptake